MATEEHRVRAARLVEAGAPTDALRAIEEAVREEPQNAEVHNLHGLILGSSSLMRQREAAEAFEKAIACRPAYAEAHCNLGAVLLTLGQKKDALRAFDAALQIDPAYEVAIRARREAQYVPGWLSASGRLSASQRALIMTLLLGGACTLLLLLLTGVTPLVAAVVGIPAGLVLWLLVIAAYVIVSGQSP